MYRPRVGGRLTLFLKCWDRARKTMMTAVQTTSRQCGRVNVMTTTTAISHHLYDKWLSLTHVDMPRVCWLCSKPTVHRGNAARTKQTSVSETMTRRARRVVDNVATLSGRTTAISRSTVIATVIHADNSLQLHTPTDQCQMTLTLSAKCQRRLRQFLRRIQCYVNDILCY